LEPEAGRLAERLARRLERLSASLWVAEVDALARDDEMTVDAALSLLARRFAGGYLEKRRDLSWTMLEYLFVRLEPEAWLAPLRYELRRARPRRGAAA
jgi:hypothetical protein